MNNLRIIKIIACFVGLVATSSMAADIPEPKYKIEVCLVPLSDIVISGAQLFVGTMQHMFIRGYDGNSWTGLNFEPNNWEELLQAKDFQSIGVAEAKIGTQNYSPTQYVQIFGTNDKSEYENRWQSYVQSFNDFKATHMYSLVSSNCQHATKHALDKHGNNVPENFNKALRTQAPGCNIQ